MNDDKLESKNTINLYYIDKSDSDKIKLCGAIQSISELNEERFSENGINVWGKFSRVKLNNSFKEELFMNGFLHPKSQKNPFIVIDTNYELNVKTIIAFVWFTKMNYIWRADDVSILENINWEASEIKSEKLDGTPFTSDDIIEFINSKKIINKSQFRIESDGINTKVFFNDEQVGLIQNIKWETDAENHFPKVTMTVLNVPVSLKMKEEHVNKIIKEYEENIKK